MNIMVKRVENVIIDSNTAYFLRSLVSELAEVACELGDEVYEVDNLSEAIEEFLDSKKCERGISPSFLFRRVTSKSVKFSLLLYCVKVSLH